MAGMRPLPMLMLFFLMASQWANAGEVPKDRWTAFMMGVPGKLELKRSVEAATSYVLKQTHEPLFRKEDGENYSSRVLTRWSRDLFKKEYCFCPDQSLEFDAANRFNAGFFAKYIKQATAKYSEDFSFMQSGECSVIRFKQPEAGYLDFLSKYENAPSVMGNKWGEVGLGPFQIGGVKEGEMRLVRKSKISGGYNEIILKEFKGVADREYSESRASDYNNVPVYYQPDWREREYQGVDTVDLQVNGIVINVPDEEVRERIYNCLDVDRFRRAFFPERKEFLDIATVLPIGMAGASPGKAVQHCPSGHWSSRKQFVLLNHIKGNDEQLSKIIDEFFSRTGIRIKIIKCTPGELVKALQSTPRGYDLIVAAIGSMQTEYSTLFNYFVRDNGFYDFRVPRVGRLHQELIHERDKNSAALRASEIASELENGEFFLPLHQNTRRLYYPKGIKNLIIGRGFVQYPEIAEFRW
jgi:hypothetical protein